MKKWSYNVLSLPAAETDPAMLGTWRGLQAVDACDDSWLRNVSHIDLFWEKLFQIETRIRLWQEWLHTITVKKQTKKQHNSQCFQSEADSHQTFNCYANTAFTGNNKYCIRFRTKFHFFFCLLVFASTLSSAILYTEHVFAFKDILLVSQTSSLDENASESKQQAVIPANNGRYCGEIFLTKLTLHHCFKISLNTV